jgi:hypothetical protein
MYGARESELDKLGVVVVVVVAADGRIRDDVWGYLFFFLDSVCFGGGWRCVLWYYGM